MEPNNNEPESRENESGISSDLIRGHINTIILRTLYDGDKYGYEIINEIESKSRGQYTLKQPTLYSALKRLESQDYVTSYWGGVSNGGRRKYFQITEKGRIIVEQNLAEWEYSRTVIDSLISEKDYNFDNPPPAHSVDFNILKKSTTRVPISKSEEQDSDDYEEQSGADKSSFSENVQEKNETESEQIATQEQDPAKAAPEQSSVSSASEQIFSEHNTQNVQASKAEHESISEKVYEETEKNISESKSSEKATASAFDEESSLSEEDRQRIHENYKMLIGNEEHAASNFYSQATRQSREEQAAYTEAPSAENIPPQPEPDPYMDNRSISSELLYSNKPPEERNYKELLAKLYDNTRKDEEEIPPAQTAATQENVYQTPPEQEPPQVRPAAQAPSSNGNIEFYDVTEKAENEGLKITTTTGVRNRTVAKSVGSTFDKGKALLFTALFVFAVGMIESIINICLRGVLETGAAYVVLPFVFCFVMLGIFLYLYLRGYGKNSRKSQSKSYISASLILYANLVLIICLIAYLIIYFSDADVSVAVQILKYAIFPCIFVFNVPLFALIYNYNSNRQ